ncbi:MAG: ComEC/Rec2 family competence protein [Patescibacteria group bacterium]
MGNQVKSRSWFFIFVLSFTLGIFLRSFVNLGTEFLFFLIFLAIALFPAYFVYRTRTVLFVSLFIFGAMLGIFRFDVSLSNRNDPALESQIGKTVVVEGIISSEPDERDDTVILVVKGEKIYDGKADKKIDSKIRFTIGRYPSYQYGDKIIIEGKIVHPKAFEDEKTKKIFDYPGYLAAQDIYYEIKYPKVSLISGGGGNIILSSLFEFKKMFLAHTARIIPEPEESLLGGLLVGAKQSLGKELLDDFRKVGIIHIVVLSGYNITIIADSIVRIFSFLPRLYASAFAGGSIILFAALVGGGATVLRATIMALLVILARYIGRVYDVTTALYLAGFLMLIHNPKILVFDPSFQLSFLATIGLIYFAPVVEKYISFIPKNLGFRDIALSTIATQIFVTPLLLYMMGMFSLVALPVNLLVLFFIPITMLFGFLTGVFGFLGTIFSLPFAYITTFFLSYIIFVVEKFSSIQFASYTIETVPIFIVLVFYIFFGTLIMKKFSRI